MNGHHTLMFSLVLYSVLSPQSSLLAEEIRWRHDYNAARREARDQGKPLLLDIGTHQCVACQRLHATTFRDAKLVALLNERLIPLKVDGGRERALIEALRIEVFPTLVVAKPDGKIVETLEGYVDAARLTEVVQRLLAVPPAATPRSRDLQEALAAIEAADYTRAVERLQRVAQDGLEPGAQARARQLLQQIEQQAAARLTHLRELMDQGHGALALEALGEFTSAFRLTVAAAEGAALAKEWAQRPEIKARQRERRARELVVQAREDFRAKRFLACLERCEALLEQYADLPDTAEAEELAAAIKENPERLQRLCAALAERHGSMQLLLAEGLLKRGRPAEAATVLEQVLQQLPGTPLADRARTRLEEVQRLFPRNAAQPSEEQRDPD